MSRMHPDLTDLAVDMERRAHARGLRTTRGLGRRWSWAEYLGHGDPAQFVNSGGASRPNAPAPIGPADGASRMARGPTEKKSRNSFDVPAFVAAGKGPAGRFAPLPAAPPTGL